MREDDPAKRNELQFLSDFYGASNLVPESGKLMLPLESFHFTEMIMTRKICFVQAKSNRIKSKSTWCCFDAVFKTFWLFDIFRWKPTRICGNGIYWNGLLTIGNQSRDVRRCQSNLRKETWKSAANEKGRRHLVVQNLWASRSFKNMRFPRQSNLDGERTAEKWLKFLKTISSQSPN